MELPNFNNLHLNFENNVYSPIPLEDGQRELAAIEEIEQYLPDMIEQLSNDENDQNSRGK